MGDISGLKARGIRTQSELNAAEAENIRRAVMKYLLTRPTRRSAKFDMPWMLRLHAEMFGQVWDWAGTVRKSELNLGSPAHRISIELHDLVEDLKSREESGMPLSEQAVRLHHRAVQIHPFLNGNGRWARLLANIWLKQHKAIPIDWPETVIGAASTIRDEYLHAVRAADKHDYGPLSVLHARFATLTGPQQTPSKHPRLDSNQRPTD